MTIKLTGDIALKEKLFRGLQKKEVVENQSVPFTLSKPEDNASRLTFYNFQIDMKKDAYAKTQILLSVWLKTLDNKGGK